MAIIKIDEAYEQLKAFAAVIVSEQEPELCVDSKTLAKSCFNLQCEHVGKIEVTFKLILEPMGGDKIRRKVIGPCRIGGSKQKGVEKPFQLVSVLAKRQEKR